MTTTNVFDVKVTRAILNKSHDAGKEKAALFGRVAMAAHNEGKSATWQFGEGSAKLNKAKFPLTSAYLKELCAPDANGIRRGDICEFATTLRKFLSLDSATRKAMLKPVDATAQAKNKSPFQHLVQTIRNEVPKKVRAPRQTTGKKTEVCKVAKFESFKAGIVALRTQFASVLPADIYAQLLDLEFAKV